MHFQREPATQELLEELIPLVVAHDEESSNYPDIPLKIDYKRYLQVEDAGLLALFTARDEKSIVGYNAFFIHPHFHRMQSLQAYEDVIFISPEARGFGGQFISWVDEQLRASDVQVIYRHVKVQLAPKHGHLLERKGYDAKEIVYAKRLDKEVG